MLGNSIASSLVNWETMTCSYVSSVSLLSDTSYHLTSTLLSLHLPWSDTWSVRTQRQNSSCGAIQNVRTNVIGRRTRASVSSLKKLELHSTAQSQVMDLTDKEREMWEACREALSAFEFSIDEKDKILAKAFGYVGSPYWSEERPKVVPRHETVKEKLNFLLSLGLSDVDLHKILKKFPEVLGCNLDEEMKNNVQILEKDWGIEGKSLRNLLLRNPKVLGYNVDCKGDCMAKCTRCWVRF
ncbi:hypothetical protein Syun_014138 [Stephania yunnanensis]|uniref:Uncharacterized protein n=1 Tax=Stephania yunnanensis TaxID=152371 RepID=A0AAP0JKF6_9MAGN